MNRPLLCLVTDRHRAASAGASEAEQCCALIERVAAAVDAGVNLIQVREPDLGARSLRSLVADIVAATRGTRARVLVNDRVDVALSAGADGVHLRASSIDVADARALAPDGWIVGRSAHTADELAAAATADFVVFGTVFETDSKPGITPQGIDALARAVTQVTCPVLGIGGMSVERAGDCASVGAAGIAGISLFMPDGVIATDDGLRARVAAIRAQFARY